MRCGFYSFLTDRALKFELHEGAQCRIDHDTDQGAHKKRQNHLHPQRKQQSAERAKREGEQYAAEEAAQRNTAARTALHRAHAEGIDRMHGKRTEARCRGITE